MNHPLIATLCIAGSLACGHSAHANDAGRIGFTGGIVERTCPFAGDRPDCPTGHAVPTGIEVMDAATARRRIGSALLDYALDRSPPAQPVAWKVVDVTFH